MRVEVAAPSGGSVAIIGLSDAVAPAGETLLLRLTVPEKPLKLVRVMVDVADDPPGRTVRLDGFGVIVKSGPTTTGTVAVWVIPPLTPVTLIM